MNIYFNSRNLHWGYMTFTNKAASCQNSLIGQHWKIFDIRWWQCIKHHQTFWAYCMPALAQCCPKETQFIGSFNFILCSSIEKPYPIYVQHEYPARHRFIGPGQLRLFSFGEQGGSVVRVLFFHQCVLGSKPIPGIILLWVEFVGSLLCSEKFFSGYSGFLLSPKVNIWFDLIWFDCGDLI